MILIDTEKASDQINRSFILYYIIVLQIKEAKYIQNYLTQRYLIELSYMIKPNYNTMLW